MSAITSSATSANIETWGVRSPHHIAIDDPGAPISYGGLIALSRRVGDALDELHVPPGSAIGVLAPKCGAAVAAAISIVAARRVYVPLDGTAPSPLLAAQLRAAGAAALVSLPDQSAALGAVASAVGGVSASTAIDELRISRLAWPTRTHDPALCYVIFTSGSSGEPKGVRVTHDNLDHFCGTAISRFGLGPDQRLFNPSPLNFDFSILEVFALTSAGGTVVCAPGGLCFPADMLGHLRTRNITLLAAVPSFFSFLSGSEPPAENWFPQLRRVIFAGEMFPISRLQQWMASYPEVSFINAYGPTEATVFVSSHEIERAPLERLPIGAPFDGVTLNVLTDGGAPAPDEEPGELWIGGVLVAQGYLSGSSQGGFVPSPFADGLDYYRSGDLAVRSGGQIYLLGRADSQIKMGGRRIELGAVEQAATSLEGVSEAVALPRRNAEGFVSGIECHVASQRSSASVRSDLAALLPRHMHPSRVIVHRELPRNISGKIDRRALAGT